MPIRFSISESGRGEDLEHNLIQLSYRIFDLAPMAERARVIMERQNEEGALMGIDQYGHTYDALARSTWKTRPGSGPPLAPRGSASRIVTGFRATVEAGGHDEMVVRGRWPGIPWIRFHKTGTRNMPERDPVGMRPHAWQQLMVEFHLWVQEVLSGRDGSGPSSAPSSGGGGGGAPSGGGKSGGPLAPAAGNGPGISRYDAPDDGDTLMIDVRPTRAASPPAAAKDNGPGLAQHGPSPDRPASPPAGDAESRYAGAEARYGSQFDRADVAARIEANTRESIRQTLGSDMTPRQIAALVGAPEDATHIYVNTAGHTGVGIEIEIHSPRLSTMKRSITARRGDRSQVVRATTIHNDEIKVAKEHQGKGLATRIFADQVEAAAAAGFQRIDTYAAREHGTYNGYSTWPKLGYDGMIPGPVLKKLPREMAGATKVSELMTTPEGRKFWDQHGISTEMSFDLTPGSYSRRVLDAYLESKGMR